MMVIATTIAGALLALLGTPTLEVPALDVQAPLVSVGFAEDGSMEIPANLQEVGLWEHGPWPGGEGPGNTVLAGHVSSPHERGAFYYLKDLEPGDLILVMDLEFEVVSVEVIRKDRVSMEDIFIGDGGQPELMLVTCGGAFRSEVRSFDSNVVVTARLLPFATTSADSTR